MYIVVISGRKLNQVFPLCVFSSAWSSILSVFDKGKFTDVRARGQAMGSRTFHLLGHSFQITLLHLKVIAICWVAAGQHGINEWHQSKHRQQQRYYHTFRPLLMAMRLKEVSDLPCPEESPVAEQQVLGRQLCHCSVLLGLHVHGALWCLRHVHFPSIMGWCFLIWMYVCVQNQLFKTMRTQEKAECWRHTGSSLSVPVPFAWGVLAGVLVMQVDLFMPHIFQSEFLQQEAH